MVSTTDRYVHYQVSSQALAYLGILGRGNSQNSDKVQGFSNGLQFSELYLCHHKLSVVIGNGRGHAHLGENIIVDEHIMESFAAVPPRE